MLEPYGGTELSGGHEVEIQNSVYGSELSSWPEEEPEAGIWTGDETEDADQAGDGSCRYSGASYHEIADTGRILNRVASMDGSDQLICLLVF